MENGEGVPLVNEQALKKARDDAVAASIKILENLYSFLISFALTQATLQMLQTWQSKLLLQTKVGASVLFFSLLLTLVPFYQGMNRYLYQAHVVRPLENPNSRSSPLLVDIYAFLLMGCIMFAMGKYIVDPRAFFYLWSTLLILDISWSLIVWIVEKSERPIWAVNNVAWLSAAWFYWLVIHLSGRVVWFSFGNNTPILYGFVPFELGRTLFDYRINWRFYFPKEYRGT